MAFRKMTSPIRKVGSALGSLGLAFGGVALIGSIGSVVNIFKDFEQANANLAAVLGKTKGEILALNNDAKRLGATTAFTASEVAGLQTEFAKLGFSQREILGATEATLGLASATSTELPQAAMQVGAAIRAFNLDASESARVADVFAASTSKSALDMEKLDVAMSKVAPVAKQFGFSIEDSVALLGKLSDAGFDASTAATSTRSIILNMADSGGKLAKALGRPVTSMDDMVAGMVELREKGIDLASMLDLTDKRSVAAFATFLEGAEGVGTLADELRKAGGTAQKMADQQLDTLGGALTILKSSYEGFILSLEDGTGGLSSQLKTITQVVSEMFSLASGSATASEALNEQEKSIRTYAKVGLAAIKIIGYMVGGLLLFKGISLAVSGALAIQRAISSALFLVDMVKYVASTQGLTMAQAALAVAQQSLNAAMAANPIGVITVAIIGLIALVSVIVNKWNDWGAALSLFIPGLGQIISLVQSFRRNWEMITEAFEKGGILAGLKAIGKTILDSVLMPLQQLLEVAARFTGSDMAARAAESIENFRANIGVETGDTGGTPAVNPEAERQDALSRTINEQRQNVAIDINDQTGRADVSSDADFVPVNLNSSMVWQ
jgi:TP901 family phage tail tape measure protein